MNRYNLIFLIIFFTFILPGPPSTPITSREQYHQLQLFRQHLSQSFDLLKNSTFNHNYGNLTGYMLSYQEALDAKGEINQTYPLPGKDYDHYANNQEFSILPDLITNKAIDVWNLNKGTSENSNYYTNVTSKLKGSFKRHNETTLTKLPLQLPTYLEHLEDVNPDFPQQPIENYPAAPPRLVGNITELEGISKMELRIISTIEGEYFNKVDDVVKFVRLDIQVSDELEYDKQTIESSGFYFVESGNIVTATNSAKFFSLYGGLQHLTLNERNFLNSKNLTIEFMRSILFDEKQEDRISEAEADFSYLTSVFDKSQNHCEYVTYFHIDAVQLTKDQIKEIDEELKNPIGRPIDFSKIPKINMKGLMYSPDCAIEIEFPGAEGVKSEIENFRLNKVVIAGIALLFAQIFLLLKQMGHSNTPSTISRISYYTIWLMSLVDGSLAMLYLIGSAIYNKLYLPFIVSAFLAFILASIFEIRFLINISMVQYNERTMTLLSAFQGRAMDDPEQQNIIQQPPPEDESQISSAVYTRFFFTLIVFTFVLLNSLMWPKDLRATFERVALLFLNSYWLPQVYRNVVKGSNNSFQWWFILGTTIVRLIPVFYVFVFKSNVFDHHQDVGLFKLITFWLAVQIGLLGLQSWFGARFFLPKAWLPNTYNYHPSLTKEDVITGKFGIEFNEQTNKDIADGFFQMDCAICMDVIRIELDDGKKHLHNNNRKEWMVTPCHHVFHSECLERHLRYKLQCPICHLDGLLINTEDTFTIVANEILSSYNKGPLTWDVRLNLQGRTGDDVSRLCCEIFGLPITAQEWKEQNIKKQSVLWKSCKLLPGAEDLIKYLKREGIPFALATSSARDNYLKKTGHLREIFDLFGEHIVTGDDPRIPEGKGKPFPDIYLTALGSLNSELSREGKSEILPSETLVFEDGLSGVKAGLAAGAFVVWVPHKEVRKLMNGEEHQHVKDSGVILDELTGFKPEDYGL
ncbi:hypothetical protein WICPIJ_004942 [Wickerhamomyces pijperi]|uniref:RING-type E3 ubiquitin transferase n=1 Tax=Wickerhamomyces pijperi TaxID=599730 RepID=A0A9P8Q4V0_WICPI|nr:hypothetical protein WICPIJ_004942 [Wickerhamomyces pijperi]